MDWLTDVLLLMALFIISGFLSGSETGLTSVNKNRLQTLMEHGNLKAKDVFQLVSNPDKLLTTILIGNNVVNIYLTALTTTLTIRYFGEENIGIATAILAVFLLIFSEITPKSVAAVFPDKVSLMVYKPIKILMFLMTPLTYCMGKLTEILIKIITKGRPLDSSVSMEEIGTMVNQASKEGVIHLDDAKMLKGMLTFKEKDVRDVLKRPRVDMIALQKNMSYEQVLRIAIEHEYTRYPVYDETIDHIIGVFNQKSLNRWSLEPHQPLEYFMDPEVLFVPETMKVKKSFKKMIHGRHIAIVLDEYGQTLGMITLEDIFEAMIGHEIEDETDKEDEVLIDELTESHIICHGDLPLRMLNEVFKVKIPLDVDTVAGFVFKELEFIPKGNESFQWHHLEIHVLEMDGSRITKVKIIKEV